MNLIFVYFSKRGGGGYWRRALIRGNMVFPDDLFKQFISLSKLLAAKFNEHCFEQADGINLPNIGIGNKTQKNALLELMLY